MVAKEWGLTPEAFWECSRQDRLLMIAYVYAERKMMGFEDKQQQNRSDFRPPTVKPSVPRIR